MSYIKIPLNIIEDKDLSSSAKILYGYLLLLTHRKGYCYASNDYLKEVLGISSRSITRLLRKLKNNHYISLKYEINYKRKIYINR